MTTETLEAVRLGMTELNVSPIAFGTWELGGEWGSFDEEKGIEAIRNARELGVNLFDTAHGYGFGASERLLGRGLRDDLDDRRDEVVIATKGGLRMTDDGLVRDSSPEVRLRRSAGSARGITARDRRRRARTPAGRNARPTARGSRRGVAGRPACRLATAASAQAVRSSR